MVEFVKLDAEESEPEQRGDRKPDLHALHLALLHLQHRETIGDRRDEQHRGVARDLPEVEQTLRRRTRGIAAAEHRIDGKADSEEEDIATTIEQEHTHRSTS